VRGPVIRRAIGLYAAGAVLLLVGAFPFLWMLSTALKPSGEIFATPPTLVPVHPTATNFTRLMAETNFVLFFQNSLAISLTTVLLTLTVSALGADPVSSMCWIWWMRPRGLSSSSPSNT